MDATPVAVWSNLQLQGTPTKGAVPFIDKNTLQPTVDDAGMHYDQDNQELGAKKLALTQGISIVNGNVALNGVGAGSVKFGAGTQSLVLTSDSIEADTLIICTVATDDATAFVAKGINNGNGTATIKLNANCTGVTVVNFLFIRSKA